MTKPNTKTKTKSITLHTRVSAEIAERLDRIAEFLVKRSPGLLPKRHLGADPL
jgi:hypothetical protein